MFIRGEIQPVRFFCPVTTHSALPRKMPGWIVLVRENVSVNKRALYGRRTIEIVLSGFLSAFFFSNFTFGFHAFHPKKLKMI